MARIRGDTVQARILAEEAVTICQEIEDNSGLALSLIVLATIACAEEDTARAAALSRAQSAALPHNGGQGAHCHVPGERLAHVALQLGETELAAQRVGSAAGLREATGTRIEPRDIVFCDTTIQQIRHQLGQDRFKAAWTAGRIRPLEEAIAEALAVDVHEDTI